MRRGSRGGLFVDKKSLTQGTRRYTEGELLLDQSLLCEEVEVVVGGGAGEDEGGEIAGDGEGVAAVVFAQGEGELEGWDGDTGRSAVVQWLAEDSGLAVGSEGIQERLAVRRIHSEVRRNARLQGGTFLVSDGILIEARIVSPDCGADDEFMVGREIG